MRRVALVVVLACACKDDHHDGGADDHADDHGSSGAGTSAGTGGSGSDSGSDGSTGEAPESAVDEAKRELPTYLDLHTKVIWRTCTPTEGVCHNDKEYPDLHTPQSMLGAIAKPCNIAVDDPIDTFDGCEGKGDVFTFMYGANADWSSEVAYVTLDPDGPMGTDAIVHLRDAIPMPMYDPMGTEGFTFTRQYEDGDVVLVEMYDAWYEQGASEVHLHDFDTLPEEHQGLLTLELDVGDPNQNGVWGADEAGFSLLVPGDPTSSYLLGRLLGNVPGTPMPLANQPLSSAEMIALTCWIEGLTAEGAGDVYAPIDYDGCDAAMSFGAPQPDSGHALAADVQPIFDQYCNAGGCHGGDQPQANLDLTAGHARASLLDAADQDHEKARVVPGNPSASYLMLKLEGKGTSGLQMPRTAYGEGEPLPAEQLQIIESWIIAGAPND